MEVEDKDGRSTWQKVSTLLRLATMIDRVSLYLTRFLAIFGAVEYVL